MANYSRFEEDVPIITSQPIESHAEGLEAIGKTLGGISSEAIQQAKEIGEEQSNVMTLQTQAHADTIKNDAYIEMIKTPDMAAKIADRAEQEYSSTINQAVVNNADRTKLKYLAQKDVNDIKLKAAQTQFENSKIEGQIGLMTSWPQQLDQLQKSVGDEQTFNTRLKTMQDAINSAVRARSITVIQGQALSKSLLHVIQAQNEYHKLYGNRDISAQDHNRAAVTIATQDNGHHGLPGDQTTIHLSTEYNNDTTIRGIESAAAQGKAPNPMAWAQITRPTQLNQVSLYTQGAVSVDADLKTGVSFANLESEYHDLKGTAVLNNYQRGRFNRLKNILNDPNAALKQDGQYQYYEAQYNQNMAAASRTANLDNQQKMQLAQHYDNQFAHQQVGLANARQLQDDHVSPIPAKYIQAGQGAFVLDKDPNSLKSSIGYWDQDLREFYARGMKTPVQQEVARAVGNLLNAGVNDSDINALVLANQVGRDYKSLTEHEPGTQGVSQPVVRYQVGAALSDVTGFVGRQVGGATRVDSMINMTTNLAYLLALQHNDLRPDKYVPQAADIVKKAYPISAGVNWVKNDKDFPALEKPQMDVIANHLIDYTKEKILAPGKSQARMSVALDSNNLKVIGTPTGKLVVSDTFGNVLYSTPYSNNLLSLAHQERETKLKKSEKESKQYQELKAEAPSQQVMTEYEKLKAQHKKELESL